MAFLYSPNRFNVATSRAQRAAIVVASPELLVPECRTPEQMRVANVFCRFREMADPVHLVTFGPSAHTEAETHSARSSHR